MMKSGINGFNLIKYYEGLRLQAYQCSAKVWTIGYGHTENVCSGDVITEDEAFFLLHQDIAESEYWVNQYVLVPLTQNQFDALVSFVFNLGVGNFRTSTLLKKLNSSDYNGAAQELLGWNLVGSKVSPGLTRRREAEKTLFLK